MNWLHIKFNPDLLALESCFLYYYLFINNRWALYVIIINLEKEEEAMPNGVVKLHINKWYV